MKINIGHENFGESQNGIVKSVEDELLSIGVEYREGIFKITLFDKTTLWLFIHHLTESAVKHDCPKELFSKMNAFFDNDMSEFEPVFNAFIDGMRMIYNQKD